MIVDEQVKRIIQEFPKITRTETMKSSISQTSSQRRTIFKQKNKLINNHVSPDIKKLYYTPKDQVIENTNQLNTPTQEQDQLREFQQIILELYPQDHPIWGELLQDSDLSIEELIAQNLEYFYSLLTLSYYQMQIKQLQNDKESIRSHQKLVTQYGNEFHKKLLTDSQLVSQKLYDRYKPKDLQIVRQETMYNSQFVPQQYKKTNSCKPDHIPNKAGMSFLTSYNSLFRDWNPKYHGRISVNDPFINKTLPLIGKSNYKSEFNKLNGEITKKAEFSKIGPFPCDPKLLIRESTNKSYFQPILEQSESCHTLIMSPKTQITKSFDGQYNSNSRKTFMSNHSSKKKEFDEKYYKSSVVRQLMKFSYQK